MTRPKSDFENQQHVPRTDVISTAIASTAWASAVARSLVDGRANRRLVACLSVDDLQVALPRIKRQVAIVEVNDKNFDSCCQLGQANLDLASPALLIGLMNEMVGAAESVSELRHVLFASGFGATFASFADLPRLSAVVRRHFQSLPPAKLSIEESTELGLPWAE